MRALPIADSWLLLVSSQGERDKRALWDSFYKGTNPFHAGSTLLT